MGMCWNAIKVWLSHYVLFVYLSLFISPATSQYMKCIELKILFDFIWLSVFWPQYTNALYSVLWTMHMSVFVYLRLVVEIFGHVVLLDPVLIDSVWANVFVHVKACALKPWHPRKWAPILSNCCGVNFDFYLCTCIYVSVYISSLSSLWESLVACWES